MTHSEDRIDRPLVTFALFAYNQEKYIREAIEGAFAQTYEPLEIVLSDDCSDDQTFEIMREMAESYRGKHFVKVRKNSINVGTALHVSLVAEEAHGALIVVAAGDDISVPERCETLVQKWVRNSQPICTLHSASWSFSYSDKDSLTYNSLRYDANEDLNIEWFLKNWSLPFISPTCAYSRELFELFPPLIGGSLIEDGPLAFRTFLKGRFLPIDAALVIRRELKETAGTGYNISDPMRWNRFLHSRMTSRATSLRDLHHAGNLTKDVRNVVEKRLIKEIRALALLLIKENPSLIDKIMFFKTLLFSEAVNAGFDKRLGYALSLLGLKESKIYFFLSRFRKLFG